MSVGKLLKGDCPLLGRLPEIEPVEPYRDIADFEVTVGRPLGVDQRTTAAAVARGVGSA